MKIYISVSLHGFLIDCEEKSPSERFSMFANTQRELMHLLYDHLGVQIRFLSGDINRLYNGEVILIEDGHLVYGKED